MYGRFFPRMLFGLLLVAGIIGVGYYGYHLGLAQGMAQGAPEAGAAIVGQGRFGFPHPFFPFWGFGCLVPLFLLFLVFGAARMMFWRGHMMGGGRHWRNRWGEGGVPPHIEEIHARMHEKMSAAPASSDVPKPEAKSGK